MNVNLLNLTVNCCTFTGMSKETVANNIVWILMSSKRTSVFLYHSIEIIQYYWFLQLHYSLKAMNNFRIAWVWWNINVMTFNSFKDRNKIHINSKLYRLLFKFLTIIYETHLSHFLYYIMRQLLLLNNANKLINLKIVTVKTTVFLQQSYLKSVS